MTLGDHVDRRIMTDSSIIYRIRTAMRIEMNHIADKKIGKNMIIFAQLGCLPVTHQQIASIMLEVREVNK